VADEQQDDYDEILRGIIRGLREKPKHSQQQIYIEKKYFDYLPNEIPTDGEDSANNEDLRAELENPASDILPDEDEDNEETAVAKRRSKRDVLPGRKKRQLWYSVPLYHHSPHPNLNFYYPIDLFSDFPDPPAYETRTFANQNPWNPQNNPNLRLRPPGNFYLPPPPTTRPPSTYLPPISPNQNRRPVK
jgi:hypothetical protein